MRSITGDIKILKEQICCRSTSMATSRSYHYKMTVCLVALLACWLCAGAQTRTVQLPHGKLVYTITNLGNTFTEHRETDIDPELLLDSHLIVSSDFAGNTMSAGTEINVDVIYYPKNDGDGYCSQLNLDANIFLTCLNANSKSSAYNQRFKGTTEEYVSKSAEDWNYSYKYYVTDKTLINQSNSKLGIVYEN